MEEISTKQENRGAFAIEQWKEMKKAGGIAPKLSEIQEILQGSNSDMKFTRQEVIERISDYFSSCTGDAVDEETGETVRVWKRNPTKAGLALSLGLSSQTLADYVSGNRSDGKPYSEAREDVKRAISNGDFDVIRKAYSLIEMFYEEKLAENRNNAGTIFWLNNLQNDRWSNEQSFKFDYQTEQRNAPTLTAADLPRLDASTNHTSATLPRFTNDGENE